MKTNEKNESDETATDGKPLLAACGSKNTEIMKKGVIKISDVLYRRDWSTLYIFMKDFRPTHIEFRHWENDVWYMYGVSEKFDPLKEGEAVPLYDLLFTMSGDGSLKYEFKLV